MALVDNFVNGEALQAAIEKSAKRDESKILGMPQDALNRLHFVLRFMCGLVPSFHPCVKKPHDLLLRLSIADIYLFQSMTGVTTLELAGGLPLVAPTAGSEGNQADCVDDVIGTVRVLRDDEPSVKIIPRATDAAFRNELQGGRDALLAGQRHQALNSVGHSVTAEEGAKWFTGDIVAKPNDEIAVQNGYLAVPHCVVAEQVDEVEFGIGWVLTREQVDLFVILKVEMFELGKCWDSVDDVSVATLGF